MSSINIISSLQSVISLSSNAVQVAGSMVGNAITLSAGGIKVLQAINTSATNMIASLQPALTIGQQALATQQQALKLGRERGLTDRESIQVAALATANLFAAERPEAIQQAMQALIGNPTPTGLKTLTHQLAVGHQQIFANNLSLAVQQASLKVGFASIQTSTAATGTLQIIASDDRGRVLVTEIDTALDGETKVATEVHGTSDPVCNTILDEFHKALAEAGVRAGDPERKSTGGLCTLTATKKFVSSNPTKSKAVPTNLAKTATPRRQATKRQQNQQF
jgi:hypothetical protein